MLQQSWCYSDRSADSALDCAAQQRRATQRRAQAQPEAGEPDDDLELLEEESDTADGPVLSPLARARAPLTDEERAAADHERQAQAAVQAEQQRQQPQASTVFSIDPPGKVYVDSPTTLHKYRRVWLALAASHPAHTAQVGQQGSAFSLACRQNPYGYEEEFEWMDLGPQWQVPPGVDLELEKAVTQTFEDATDPTRQGLTASRAPSSQHLAGSF